MFRKRIMRMVFIVLLYLSISSVNAQTVGLYGFGGYGLGRGGSLWASSQTFNSTLDLTAVKDHYLNAGEGLRFGGGLQISFSRYFGIRIFGEYSSMPQLTETDMFHGYVHPDRYLYNSNVMSIQSLFLFSPNFQGFNPYAGIGGGLFFSNLSTDGEIWWSDGTSDDFKFEERFNPSLGFTGVLGVQIPFGSFLMLFMEAGFQMVSYTLKEREMVQYHEDGVDALGDFDWDWQTPGNQLVILYEKDNPEKMRPGLCRVPMSALRLEL
jgi:hypothetical protein